MPGSLQSKGDGEFPFFGPFTGLDVSKPSILLPPTAQDSQTSPSFSIVRGSLAAPWPYAVNNLFGSGCGTNEQFLFATPSGYVVTNQFIYQIQGTNTPATAWQLVKVATMPAGAFPVVGPDNPVPFVEANGCLYFACALGIWRYVNPAVSGVAAIVGPGGTLSPGNYFVVVTAIDVNGVESSTSAELDFLVLGPPLGNGSFGVQWNAVPNARSYNVYLGNFSGQENEVFSTTATTINITSYTPGVAVPPFPLEAWSVAFTAQYLSIFQQRMVAVQTKPVSQTTTVTPAPVGTQGSGGSLADGTYYAVVTAVFPSGTEGPPSPEGSVLVSAGGGTATIAWTWTAVTGATSYNIYIGTAPGVENEVFTSNTNSFTLSTYTAGTTSPPIFPPFGPWTVAWSAVSTFSASSIGSFNTNPNTLNGVVGGFDVLTNYSQGIPVGLVNLGHSLYVQMTQGIVEIDPSASGTSAFTLYNYWQANFPVGAILGTVAQYGPITAFVTPDNVDLWVPGSTTQIGGPVMPLIRKLFLNSSLIETNGAVWPVLENPCVNASFVTVYGELHYVLSFNILGIPPVDFAPSYPDQPTLQQFGLILDYNFASQSWAQQLTPPLTTEIYQVNGPPLTTPTYSQVPKQSLLIAGTRANVSAPTQWIVFGADVFNQLGWNGAQCQGLLSNPQLCQVGFPQTSISSGHRPANRRVRIEYSMDDLSCATQTASVNLTVSIQGTITQNTAAVNAANGVATTTIQSVSQTIQLNPPGTIAVNHLNPVVPFLTATAYADMVLSCENPQISLSWTDPSAHQRLLIHRVSLQTNDTKGVTQ